jgi:hypothetical protein
MAMSSPVLSGVNVGTKISHKDAKQLKSIMEAPAKNAENLAKFGSSGSTAAAAQALANQTGGNIMGFTYE